MKSRKEIKDKTIKILRIVFSNSSRTIWIMALVGGFFAANLRQNGRLNLINQGSGSSFTINGDIEYNEPYDENLCGIMFVDFLTAESEYKVKTGETTQEQIENAEPLSEERSRESRAFINRFVETCETTLGKTAKNGYWSTVLVWTFFSWIGMTIARELVKD